MAYGLKIDTDDGEIELEIKITYHEPPVPDTWEEPGHGGDIDYNIISSTPISDYEPDEMEDELILEFLAERLKDELDQAREDFELRNVV